MRRGKPTTVGKNKVSIRVLLPKADYKALSEIAKVERTDISALVRRAIARYFFVPEKHNPVTQDK